MKWSDLNLFFVGSEVGGRGKGEVEIEIGPDRILTPLAAWVLVTCTLQGSHPIGSPGLSTCVLCLIPTVVVPTLGMHGPCVVILSMDVSVYSLMYLPYVPLTLTYRTYLHYALCTVYVYIYGCTYACAQNMRSAHPWIGGGLNSRCLPSLQIATQIVTNLRSASSGPLDLRGREHEYV